MFFKVTDFPNSVNYCMPIEIGFGNVVTQILIEVQAEAELHET